jgi:hypothetical protein
MKKSRHKRKVRWAALRQNTDEKIGLLTLPSAANSLLRCQFPKITDLFSPEWLNS